jgi:predicted neuraminidase
MLRERCSVLAFRNWVLGKVFGTERDESTEDWRKELNEELQDLYSSPNSMRLIKENEIGGACGTYGTERKCM